MCEIYCTLSVEAEDALHRPIRIHLPKSPDALAFCPYRISPLGAHIDHQFGKINGLAIDKGIHFAYSKKESGICEVQSVNFPGKRAQFHVNSVPETKQGDWADHLRGATLADAQREAPSAIRGGGRSGRLSAHRRIVLLRRIIVFLSALCQVNEILLNDWELIMMAKAAENQYIGVNCGKLGQSCEALCHKDQLLCLDTIDDSYELIPTPASMKPYKIAIFFSGFEHSLVVSKYNARVDECGASAYALKAISGMPYEKYADTRLWDVPSAVFEQYGDRLP